jgi:hypothetical protein
MDSPKLQQPNPTFIVAQGRRSRDPCKPEGKLATAVMEIRIRAPKSSMKTIPGVAVLRRVAPAPPRRPGSPLGERLRRQTLG